MWWAHALTLARIPIAVALWWTYGDPVWSIALVALAALTDAADGRVARWMQRRGRTEPAIGGWLDPLVDKLFVAAVLVVIWIEAGERLIVVLVGVRELLLMPVAALYVAHHRRARELHADPIGKLATVAQLVAIAAVLGEQGWALYAAIAAAGLGAAAAAHYALRELRMQR